MAAAAIFDFKIGEVSFSVGARRAQLHHSAKRLQNQSFHCGDIVFFIFKITVAAIMDFRNGEILLTHKVRSAEMRHYSKFHQNQSIRCGNIAIFRMFTIAAATILDL